MNKSTHGTATPSSLSGSLVSRLVLHAHRARQHLVSVRLRKHGLSPAQWSVLRELADRAMPMSELAQSIGARTSNLTPVVDAMVRKKWLRRSRTARDRRSIRVRLTASGEKLRHEVAVEVRGDEADAVRGLSTRDQDNLCRLLQKFTAGAMALGEQERAAP